MSQKLENLFKSGSGCRSGEKENAPKSWMLDMIKKKMCGTDRKIFGNT